MSADKTSINQTRPPIGRFFVTADCVVFGLDLTASTLKIVLVKRKEEPFLDWWSLPGGFVQSDERAEEAARRILKQKTGLENVFLEQLYTFDDFGRDPRTGEDFGVRIDRIISMGFFALVSPAQHEVRFLGGGNAAEAQWFSIDQLPDAGRLSFDHNHIFDVALGRLRGKLSYVPIGFELLENKFTIKQLQRVYEIVLGHKLESSNFRRRVLKMDILEPLEERQESVSHRPAQLYRFNETRYRQMVERGLDFEL
ncbi:MAG: NUDIX domain-containing protein [Pyrinomonadaceae bacterium]